MNALERYYNQDQDNAGMQKPFQTVSDLYVWEQWTWKGTDITSIRFYCEDINGGETFRLSQEQFQEMVKLNIETYVRPKITL